MTTIQVFKIINNVDDMIYVAGTIQKKIGQKLRVMKSCSNGLPILKAYFDKYGRENCSWERIKNYYDQDKDALKDHVNRHLKRLKDVAVNYEPPKKPVKVEKYTITIYKIESYDGDQIYLGSTSQSLPKRYRDHVEKYELGTSTCMSRKLFRTYGVENCYITAIKKYKVGSRSEQYEKERRHYDELEEYLVNKQKPFLSKEEKLEYNRQAREKRKLKIDPTKPIKCNCGGQYTHNNKTSHLRTKLHKAFIAKQCSECSSDSDSDSDDE